MRDEAGVVDGVAVVAVDVTAQVVARDTIAQKAKQSDFEASVGVALTSGDPLPVQLTRCCEAMVRLGAAFARIWIHDEASGLLELRASAGLYTHLDGAHGRVKVGEFKIGRTNVVDRRLSELGAMSAIEPTLIHEIKTDDPAGVEAYWHRRFADRRMRGEWFRLTTLDVAAFRHWRRIF